MGSRLHHLIIIYVYFEKSKIPSENNGRIQDPIKQSLLPNIRTIQGHFHTRVAGIISLWLEAWRVPPCNFEDTVSARDRARRALVSVLQQLAALYSVILDVTRESPDSAIKTAYRKVSRKAHPDRGGVE